MKRSKILRTLIAGGFLSALLCSAAHAVTAQPGAQFEVTRHYALQGAERWDYVAYDPVRHHLFVSRDSHVQVVDTHTGKLVGEIENTDGVHGFAFVQDRKLGFVTNGRANTITVVISIR